MYSIEEKSKLTNKKLNFQRCFYSLIGSGIILGIIFLTFGQIRNLTKENHEFALYILVLIYSGI